MNASRSIVLIFLFVGSLFATARIGAACDRCHSKAPCNKVCRLVQEEKKVDVDCWGMECEDFCVPGPSEPKCQHCETVCEFCQEKDSKVKAKIKKFVWTDWLPGEASVLTKKKLMKRTVTKTVPSYKWVVEDLCAECRAKATSVKPDPGTPVPPKPLLHASYLP